MSDVTNAVLQVTQTWKPPLGFANVQRNGSLLVETILKSFGNVYSHKNLDAAVAMLGDQISWERGYVPSEIAQIWNEWWNTYAPKTIQRSANNQATIKAYLDKFFNGLVTIQNLNLAQPNLSLALVPEQTAQEHANLLAEKAAKAEAQQLKRTQKEQLENSEAAFFERAKAAEAKRDAENEAKRQDGAKEALNNEIMSYECYRGPNARDWSAIETVISDLKRIAVRVSGKVDFVKTLALVRQVKSALPDAPKLGDVQKTVDRISEQQQAAREHPVDRKTLEASSWAQRPR